MGDCNFIVKTFIEALLYRNGDCNITVKTFIGYFTIYDLFDYICEKQ